MEPKRRLTPAVVGGFIFASVVAFIINVASARIDSHLVESRGSGYPMQFVFTAVGWQYLPHIIAVVGIIAVWWWSQQAPPQELRVERVVEYRDPPPPAPPPPPRAPVRIPDGEIIWEEQPMGLDGPRPKGFCAEHPHQEIWLYNRYGNGNSRVERAGDAWPRNAFESSPYCLTGNHDVTASGNQGFFEARNRAQGRIEAERRRLAMEARR